MEKELDNIDKSIIRILQENARTPVKDIAKEEIGRASCRERV